MFLVPRKISQNISTTSLFSVPLSRWLLQIEAHYSTLKPPYFPPALQDTQLPPVFTSKPLFKQTEVAAIYLAHKHTLLYTQQESKLQKGSANEEIQTVMSAAINRQNCPNRSELDQPLLHQSPNQFLQLLKETRTKHKQSD